MVVQASRVVVAVLFEGKQALPVSSGDRAFHVKGEVPSFPVGREVAGRVLSPLGLPADGLPPLSSSTAHLPSLSPPSPPLMHRASPTHFLSTGFKHLDFFHPLTRGLRIGLLGDKLTGKTTLAVDSLIWVVQQGRGKGRDAVKGVYVCVGKKRAEVRRIRERFLAAGVLEDVTIISSSDADSHASQYLAPFSGCTVADWYRDQGQHAVIVYDDLVTHGAICNGIDKSERQLHARCEGVVACASSLTLCSAAVRRSIGFPSLSTSYIHARLLERTAAMKGGGSAQHYPPHPALLPSQLRAHPPRSSSPVHRSSTAICILESPRPERAVSVIESLVGFVDHCVYLDAHMAADSYWPAINCSSIIGRPSARFRSPLTRSITNAMSQTMLQSERTANQYAWAKEFGLEETDDEDEDILTYREKLQLLLSQRAPMALQDQFLTLMAATRRNLAAVPFEALEGFEAALQGGVKADAPEVYAQLRTVCESEEVQKEFSGTLRQQLEEAVQRFMTTWTRQNGYQLYDAEEQR